MNLTLFSIPVRRRHITAVKENIMYRKNMKPFMLALVFALTAFPVLSAHAEKGTGSTPLYDKSAYTDYVATTMKKLDKLYLQFCDKCNTDAAAATKAKVEYYKTVRDLLEYMNGRFDKLDPKKGAALSDTESLISIHVLTMLVDMLTETQLKEMTSHPYN
jgi:hypothetical protein